MIEYRMRPLFQKIFVDPLANILKNKVNPNMITLCSLVIGLFAAVFISVDFRTIAIILILISGYLDILDGSLARAQNSSSAFGTMLDILSDRIVESFIIIALYIRQPELGLIALLMMMSIIICISSFLLVGIFSENNSKKSFHYSNGLMERAETFVVFILMILWPWGSMLIGMIFVILVLWTTVYRIYEFTKSMQNG